MAQRRTPMALYLQQHWRQDGRPQTNRDAARTRPQPAKTAGRPAK